jgi:hypothetical protein
VLHGSAARHAAAIRRMILMRKLLPVAASMVASDFLVAVIAQA